MTLKLLIIENFLLCRQLTVSFLCLLIRIISACHYTVMQDQLQFIYVYKPGYCLFQLQKLLRYLDTVLASLLVSYLNSLLAASICVHDAKLQLVALCDYYQYLASQLTVFNLAIITKLQYGQLGLDIFFVVIFLHHRNQVSFKCIFKHFKAL